MNKKSLIKKLQNRGLNLFYQCVRARDKVCQIGVYFPAHCFHSDVLNSHHIFEKSKHRNICLDVENSCLLCSGCHSALSYGNDAYREMVRKIVEKRNPDIYARLFEQAQIHGPHLCWKDITWLETNISVLEKILIVL